jgi:hypothetical protein
MLHVYKYKKIMMTFFVIVTSRKNKNHVIIKLVVLTQIYNDFFLNN